MDPAKIRNIIFFALFGIVLIGTMVIVLPFFYPIFWAAVAAVIFRPVYKKLNARKHSPNFNALVSVMLILLIIILPLGFVGTLLVNESMTMFSSLSDESSPIRGTFKSAIEALKHNRYTARFNIDETFWTDKLSEFARDLSAFIYTHLKNVTQNVLEFVIMFIIMVYTLFFFIRDGDRLPDIFARLCPLGDNREKLLIQKFIATTRATLKSVFVIGSIQGSLGGLAFWVLGIQGALVWGVVMVFASILPIGSSLIWFPASIILLLTSNVWKGIILLSFGIVVIGTVDNFLRPILIGKELEMHPLLILFSTLGGLVFFGFSGFVIGPVIMSVLLALWDLYNTYYSDNLACDENSPSDNQM
jgi:predicted PurR-regulated permease PerM